MIEVLIIAILAALLGWEKHQNRIERAKMLNAIMSKSTEEMVNLELADKTKIETSPEPEPDIVPTSAIPDDEYLEMITGKKVGKK